MPGREVIEGGLGQVVGQVPCVCVIERSGKGHVCACVGLEFGSPLFLLPF